MTTLAELCIAAVAEAFRDEREMIGTGIGPIPRLGVGLAKLTHSPGLMMTDGEAYLVEQPVPIEWNEEEEAAAELARQKAKDADDAVITH